MDIATEQKRLQPLVSKVCRDGAKLKWQKLSRCVNLPNVLVPCETATSLTNA